MKSVIDEYLVGYSKKQKKQNPEWYREYYNKTKDRQRARTKKYYLKRKAEGTVGIRITGEKRGEKCRRPNYFKELYRRNRQACLDAYGGKCTCCGENTYEFLCIDHIANDGKQHRLTLTKGGDSIYRWLKRNNYPDGFQVLCHNCNLAKAFYGICPHQKKINKCGKWIKG